MYYRHLAQHQYILQHALREATGVDIVPGDPNEKPKSYTDQEFIDYLGLTETTPKKLSAFRKFHIQDNITSKFSFTPPNEIRSPLGHRADCEKIWNYLSKREFIRSAMERMQGDVDKKVMYHEREYGSTMSCFYNAHTSQIAKHAAEGLANIVSYGDEGKGKEWFLYKRSFKREGCLIKSRFTITNIDNQYFKVEDHQHSSGKHEDNNAHYDENSSGFAFSKSEKLWCVLSEETYEQPRIICLYEIEQPTSRSSQSESGKISHIYGHIMENDRLFKTGFNQSPVILVSVEYESMEWWKQRKAQQKTNDFNKDKQIDIHYMKEPDKLNDAIFIPDFVKEHFKDLP